MHHYSSSVELSFHWLAVSSIVYKLSCLSDTEFGYMRLCDSFFQDVAVQQDFHSQKLGGFVHPTFYCGDRHI